MLIWALVPLALVCLGPGAVDPVRVLFYFGKTYKCELQGIAMQGIVRHCRPLQGNPLESQGGFFRVLSSLMERLLYGHCLAFQGHR